MKLQVLLLIVLITLPEMTLQHKGGKKVRRRRRRRKNKKTKSRSRSRSGSRSRSRSSSDSSSQYCKCRHSYSPKKKCKDTCELPEGLIKANIKMSKPIQQFGQCTTTSDFLCLGLDANNIVIPQSCSEGNLEFLFETIPSNDASITNIFPLIIDGVNGGNGGCLSNVSNENGDLVFIPVTTPNCYEGCMDFQLIGDFIQLVNAPTSETFNIFGGKILLAQRLADFDNCNSLVTITPN